VALAAPGRLLLHNTGEAFSAIWAEKLYRTLRSPENVVVSAGKTSASRITGFLLG